MSTLDQRLTDLAAKTGGNFRAVNARIDGELGTAEKSNLAVAITELAERVPVNIAVGVVPPASPSLNDLWVDTGP